MGNVNTYFDVPFDTKEPAEYTYIPNDVCSPTSLPFISIRLPKEQENERT